MVALRPRYVIWVWMALLVAKGLVALEEEDEEEEVSSIEDEDEQIPVSDHELPRENIKTRPDYRGTGHWATPAPDSNIDLGFVPVKMYAQVRRSNTVKHLPRSDALASASTPEEIANAPRLREVVSHKKLSEVYSEEGYEDSAYDHGGYDKNAENHEGYEKGEGRRKPKRRPHHEDSESEGSSNQEHELAPEGESTGPRMRHKVMRQENLMISMEDHTDGQEPITLTAGYSHTINHPGTHSQPVSTHAEKRHDQVQLPVGSAIHLGTHTNNSLDPVFESLRHRTKPAAGRTVTVPNEALTLQSRHDTAAPVSGAEPTAESQEKVLQIQQRVSPEEDRSRSHGNAHRPVTETNTKNESSEGLWLPHFLRLPWFRAGEFKNTESRDGTNAALHSETTGKVTGKNFHSEQDSKEEQTNSSPKQTEWFQPQESHKFSIPIRNNIQSIHSKHDNSKMSVANNDKISHAYWKPTYELRLPGASNYNVNISTLTPDQLPNVYWKPTYHLRQPGKSVQSNLMVSKSPDSATISATAPTEEQPRTNPPIPLQGIVIQNPSNQEHYLNPVQPQIILIPIQNPPATLLEYVGGTTGAEGQSQEHSLLGNALLSLQGLPQQQIQPLQANQDEGAVPSVQASVATQASQMVSTLQHITSLPIDYATRVAVSTASAIPTTQQVFSLPTSSTLPVALPTMAHRESHQPLVQGYSPSLQVTGTPSSAGVQHWQDSPTFAATGRPSSTGTQHGRDPGPSASSQAFSATAPALVAVPSQVLRPPDSPTELSTVQSSNAREILSEGESTNLGENFAPQGFWGAEGFWGPLQKLVQEDKPKIKFVAPAYGRIIKTTTASKLVSNINTDKDSTHHEDIELENEDSSHDLNKEENSEHQDSINEESIIKENTTDAVPSKESDTTIISTTERYDVLTSPDVTSAQSTTNPSKATQLKKVSDMARTTLLKYHKQLNKHDRLKSQETSPTSDDSVDPAQAKYIERLTLAQFSSPDTAGKSQPAGSGTGRRRSYMRDSSWWHADDEPAVAQPTDQQSSATDLHGRYKYATMIPAKSGRNLRSVRAFGASSDDDSGEKSRDKRRYLSSEDEDRRVEEEAQRLEENKEREVNENSEDWKEAVRIAALGKKPVKPFNSIKYPYYKSPPSHMLSPYSPLRYAVNPKDVPRKTEGGMEFYESREQVYCPEVSPDLDVVPKRNKPGDWNKKPRARLPRLRGLGDKIDCLRTKYFGLDPLDNPFFKEKAVGSPEAASSVRVDAIDFDDQLGFYADIKGFIKNIQGLGNPDGHSQSTRITESQFVPIHPQATQQYSTTRNNFPPPEKTRNHNPVKHNSLKTTQYGSHSRPLDKNRKETYTPVKYPAKTGHLEEYLSPPKSPVITSSPVRGRYQHVGSYNNCRRRYPLYSKGIIPPPKTTYLLPLLPYPTQGAPSYPVPAQVATEGYRDIVVGMLPPPPADQPAAESAFRPEYGQGAVVVEDSMASESDMSVAETSLPQVVVDLQGNPVSPSESGRQDQDAVASQLIEESKRVIHYEETLSDPSEEDVYVEKRYKPRTLSKEDTPRARSKESRSHKSTRVSTRKVYNSEPRSSTTEDALPLEDVSLQRMKSSRRSDDDEKSVDAYPSRTTQRGNDRRRSDESSTQDSDRFESVKRNKNAGALARVHDRSRDVEKWEELRKRNRGTTKSRGSNVEKRPRDSDKRRGEPRYLTEDEVPVTSQRYRAHGNSRKGGAGDTQLPAEDIERDKYRQEDVVIPHRFGRFKNTRKGEGKVNENNLAIAKQSNTPQENVDLDYQTPIVDNQEEVLSDVSYDYGTEYEGIDTRNMSEPRPFTEEQDLKTDDTERVRYRQLDNRKVVEKLKGSASWLTPQQVNRVLGGFISRHHPTYSSRYNSEEATFPLEEEQNDTITTTTATPPTLYVPTVPITITSTTTTTVKPPRKYNRSNGLRVVPIKNVRLVPELVTSTEKTVETFRNKPKRPNSRTSTHPEVTADHSGSRWQRGREKQRTYSSEVGDASLSSSRRGEANKIKSYKEVTSTDEVHKRRNPSEKERTSGRWRSTDDSSTESNHESNNRGHRSRSKDTTSDNKVSETPQANVEISKSRPTSRRGRERTANSNIVQSRAPRPVTSRTTTEPEESSTTVSPRRLQAVEHRRVTKEEIFTRTYIPDDDLADEMEREAEDNAEEEPNKREVENEEEVYEPYESLHYEPEFVEYQGNRLGHVETSSGKEDWEEKPPYYQDIVNEKASDDNVDIRPPILKVNHPGAKSSDHYREESDHATEPERGDKVRKNTQRKINEPFSGRHISEKLEVKPRMVVTKDGVKGFYIQRPLEVIPPEKEKTPSRDGLNREGDKSEKTLAYYVDSASGTGRWAEEGEGEVVRKSNSNRSPQNVASAPDASGTEWVSVRGAPREVPSETSHVQAHPHDMHIEEHRKHEGESAAVGSSAARYRDPASDKGESESSSSRKERVKSKNGLRSGSSIKNDSTKRYRDKANTDRNKEYHAEDDVFVTEKSTSTYESRRSSARPKQRRIHDGDQGQEDGEFTDTPSKEHVSRNRGGPRLDENTQQYEEHQYEEEVRGNENNKLTKGRVGNGDHRGVRSKGIRARSEKKDRDESSRTQETQQEEQVEEDLDHEVYVLGRILSGVPPGQRATVVQGMSGRERSKSKHTEFVEDPGKRRYFYVDDDTEVGSERVAEEEEGQESQPMARRKHSRRVQ